MTEMLVGLEVARSHQHALLLDALEHILPAPLPGGLVYVGSRTPAWLLHLHLAVKHIAHQDALLTRGGDQDVEVAGVCPGVGSVVISGLMVCSSSMMSMAPKP